MGDLPPAGLMPPAAGLDTFMNSVLQFARQYRQSGVNVLPVKHDGTKTPAPEGLDADGKWKYLQDRMATESDLLRFFSNGNGIAAVAGPISGNLEDFDFDDTGAFHEWQELVIEHLGESFWESLLIVETPRPGYAVIGRCPDGIEGSQKLAMAVNPKFGQPGEPAYITLIETKGAGGYFLLPGCPPECHPSGRTYSVIQGSFQHIPEWTSEQREVLLTCARSFDQKPREQYKPETPRSRVAGELLPGDDYNLNGPEWMDILRPHGFRFYKSHGSVSYWTRPGKNFGISASTNFEGSDLFYVFSTNCFPFDSERAYTKFTVYALLNHGSNFHAAGKALYADGYGTRRETKEEREAEENAAIDDAVHHAVKEDAARPQAVSHDSGFQEETYIEFAPSFLAVEDPPIQYLVNELIPERVIALVHGEPRTQKSWAALDLAIALATGTPAFGLERLRVDQPVRVLYSSQEDAAPLVRLRAKALLKGRSIEHWPETLAFSVHRGIDLERSEWHERLLRDVRRFGFRLLTFDPIRRYGLNVDKGPAEVRAITAYLRRLCVETGVSVSLIHHDVKPPASGKDERRRSQKASGGDWFAASECPMSFEEAGDHRTLVYPEHYKFSADPEPFSFRLETDHLQQPTVARLIGETTNAEQAADLAAQEKILGFLKDHPRTATRDVERGCRMRNGDGKPMLERLAERGLIDALVQGKGKATLWWIL